MVGEVQLGTVKVIECCTTLTRVKNISILHVRKDYLKIIKYEKNIIFIFNFQFITW